MTPEEIGEYLEHRGATDEEIEDFLEHFGVKGMKWGVRRDNRANTFKKVGSRSGKAKRSEKIRAYTQLGPIDLVKGRGFKGGAARKGDRLLKRNKRVRDGEASVLDLVKYVGGTRYQDVIPTKRGRSDTRTAIGASVAGSILVSAGLAYAKNRLVDSD